MDGFSHYVFLFGDLCNRPIEYGVKDPVSLLIQGQVNEAQRFADEGPVKQSAR